MKIFRRLKTSLSVQCDRVLGQIENHEALADCAIRDLDQTLRRGRAKLGRIERDLANMERRREELRNAEALWHDRALKVKEDKERAMECIRRREQARAERETLEKVIAEQREIESRLRADFSGIEAKISEMKRRKTALAAREIHSEALEIVEPECGSVIPDLEAVFERWEERIGVFGPAPRKDEVAEGFAKLEEAEHLERLFQELDRGGSAGR